MSAGQLREQSALSIRLTPPICPPNVNMASRLEAATKQFGATILFSEDFATLLSPRVRQRVRQIDCVTVKGSTRPMGLFTYDVTTERVQAPIDIQQPADYDLPGG